MSFESGAKQGETKGLTGEEQFGPDTKGVHRHESGKSAVREQNFQGREQSEEVVGDLGRRRCVQVGVCAGTTGERAMKAESFWWLLCCQVFPKEKMWPRDGRGPAQILAASQKPGWAWDSHLPG